MVVSGSASARRAASAPMSTAASGFARTSISRGSGNSSASGPDPSHGFSNWASFCGDNASATAIPGVARSTASAISTLISSATWSSSPPNGITWTVMVPLSPLRQSAPAADSTMVAASAMAAR